MFVLCVCVCCGGGCEYVSASMCVFVSLWLFSLCEENDEVGKLRGGEDKRRVGGSNL